MPLPSFRAVSEAVAAREAEYGVLPIESSLAGPVTETHDLLWDSPLSIVGQTMLPIRHLLLAAGKLATEGVRVIYSHPVALDQCRELLARLPKATVIAMPTTADAAKHVAESGIEGEAAIASERAAELYGLTVLEADVGDRPEAYTRFVAIATWTRVDRRDVPFRTAFSFVTDHRPGALHRALEPFARHGIDLLQLVSADSPVGVALSLRRRPRRAPARRGGPCGAHRGSGDDAADRRLRLVSGRVDGRRGLPPVPAGLGLDVKPGRSPRDRRRATR